MRARPQSFAAGRALALALAVGLAEKAALRPTPYDHRSD
jgi:hypothetical protein